MFEFIEICLQPVNLPFSILLMVVMMYWVLFVLGTVGLDMLDFDVDADVEVDLDVDLDVDADLALESGDADLDVDAGSGEVAHFHPVLSMLRFVNIGEVPTMIVASVLILCMWSINLLANYYLNQPFSTMLALGMLVPVFVGAAVSTKLLTLPLRAVFRRANDGIAKPTQFVGKRCTVVSQEVTTKYGQAELLQDETNATPITINVRSKPEQTLTKGAEALIVDHDEEKDTFLIVPFHMGVN